MKKVIYTLIVLLVVAGGLVYANREHKKECSPKTDTGKVPVKDVRTEREKWEATPAGIAFKEWEASPAGKKVLDGAAKIKGPTSDYSDMKAVITSLSLPQGSRLGFGVMVRINDDDYILSFGPEESNEFQQLRSLKVNDKVVIKSRYVSYAPKYAYPIISGDFVERNGKTLFKKVPRKDGC